VDCIHPKEDEASFADAPHLYVNPADCIDCGACIPVCPTNSIYTLEDLPADLAHFAKRTRPTTTDPAAAERYSDHSIYPRLPASESERQPRLGLSSADRTRERESDAPGQFAEALSALSMTITSNGPLVAFSLRPSCS
jgi:ferredoxin